jgi:hypothetical protein
MALYSIVHYSLAVFDAIAWFGDLLLYQRVRLDQNKRIG